MRSGLYMRFGFLQLVHALVGDSEKELRLFVRGNGLEFGDDSDVITLLEFLHVLLVWFVAGPRGFPEEALLRLADSEREAAVFGGLNACFTPWW